MLLWNKEFCGAREGKNYEEKPPAREGGAREHANYNLMSELSKVLAKIFFRIEVVWFQTNFPFFIVSASRQTDCSVLA